MACLYTHRLWLVFLRLIADIRDLGGLLTQAGMALTTIDSDEIVVNYPSIFELMHDLRAMGESNAARGRRGFISRDSLISAAAIYQTMYNDDDKTPATFQILHLVIKIETKSRLDGNLQGHSHSH